MPNVNIAQILAIVDGYERAQIYERVPNVNLLQILSDAQIYERVPNVDIAQILSEVNNGSSACIAQHASNEQQKQRAIQGDPAC